MSRDYIDQPIVERIAHPVFDWLHRRHGLPVTMLAVEFWIGVAVTGLLTQWISHRTTSHPAVVFIAGLLFLFFITGFLLRAQKRHRDWESAPERMSGRWPAATRQDVVVRVFWLGLLAFLGLPKWIERLAEGNYLTFAVFAIHDLLITAALYADACPALPPSAWKPKVRYSMQAASTN